MDPRRSAVLALIVLACTGIGWMAGRHSGASREDEILSALHALADNRPSGAWDASSHCVTVLSPEATAALRADIGRIVKEQLATPHAKDVAAAPTPESPKAPEPTPESVTAHDEALALIDHATGSQTWTEADADAFRHMTHRMNPDQLRQVTQKLIAELNAGHLKLSGTNRPF